nr:hypothetical protein [Nostoc sp. DedQUE03]MDZ8046249.1 hypothetical protein [Nostoc sp. DedQUE02]
MPLAYFYQDLWFLAGKKGNRLSNNVQDVAQAIASIYRAEWGRIVATLIRLVGDFDLAEETATLWNGYLSHVIIRLAGWLLI